MDFDTQQQLIAQRLRNYQDQSQYQNPQGRMAGNVYVAPHFLEYLANGLRAGGGMAGQSMAEQDLKKLDAEKQQATQKDIQTFIKTLRGSPEQQVPSMAPTVGNDPNNPQMVTNPAVPGDPYAAYSALAGSQVGNLQKMGIQGLGQLPELDAKREDRATERDFRRSQQQATLEQQRALAQQGFDLRRDLAAQAAADRAANRPEKLIAVIGQDGKPVLVPQSQAVGMTPFKGGGGAPGSKPPLTEGEAKGTLYLGQMRSASGVLDKLESSNPMAVGLAGNSFTNFLAPENAQKVNQAQNQWSEAFLRAKTGAAATPEEVTLNNLTFFPKPGDSAATIEQKKAARAQAERDMEAPAGRGAAGAGAQPDAPPSLPSADAIAAEIARRNGGK